MTSLTSTMKSRSSQNLLLLVHLPSSFAHPLHSPSNSHIFALKRRVVIHSRLLGLGFAVAICLIIIVGLAFNLGRRRERSGNWYCWGEKAQDSTSNSTALPELEETPEESKIKYRNVWPKPRSISSLVELQSPMNPVEVEWRPCFQELPSKEIYEMDSPSVSGRRSSWMSQPTWWARYRKESNARSDKSADNDETTSIKQPPYLKATHMPSNKTGNQEKQRDSSGAASMDWRGSGLEHVRQVYAQKKTDLAIEGTPWY